MHSANVPRISHPDFRFQLVIGRLRREPTLRANHFDGTERTPQPIQSLPSNNSCSRLPAVWFNRINEGVRI